MNDKNTKLNNSKSNMIIKADDKKSRNGFSIYYDNIY